MAGRVQCVEQLGAGLLGKPAVGGERVDGDRDHGVLRSWRRLASARLAEQQELVVLDVEVSVVREAGLRLAA